MKRSIFKDKKWTIFAIFIVLIILFVIVIRSGLQEKKKEMAEIQKIESEYNGEFADDSVLIVTTKERHELNKEYKLNEFPEIELESIEVLMETEDGDILGLHLKKPSRQNVLKAVYRLRNNPIVLHCEVNGIHSIY